MYDQYDKENDIMLYTNNSIDEYISKGDLVLYLDPYYKETINKINMPKK